MNFDLRWLKPCLSTIPTSLETTLHLGDTTSQTLTLINSGAGTATFEFQEKPEIPLIFVTVKAPAFNGSPDPAAKVGPAGIQSHPATSIVYKTPAVPLANYDLLLISPDSTTGDISSLLTTLSAYPDLNVTVWDNTAGNPTATNMAPYDVVIIGNDYLWNSASLDLVTIGNALADYIDGGGKVIESLYIQSYDEWGLGGRYMTDGYSPFSTATLDVWNADNMTIINTGHPVMNGVTNIGDNWGHQDPGLQTGATLLASWNTSGYNAVAVDNNVVALNLLIFSGADWTGDVGLLLHNAVEWLVVKQDVPWLAEAPITGTISADSSVLTDVFFNAGAVTQLGRYHATLIVRSNDPGLGTIDIPVTMTVGIDYYGVVLSPSSAAQSEDPGATVTYTLRITNTGNVADTFTLSKSGNAWTTDAPTSVGPLAASAGVELQVAVHIPPGASGGANDVAIINATSQSDPTQSDSAVLTTTANQISWYVYLPTVRK